MHSGYLPYNVLVLLSIYLTVYRTAALVQQHGCTNFTRDWSASTSVLPNAGAPEHCDCDALLPRFYLGDAGSYSLAPVHRAESVDLERRGLGEHYFLDRGEVTVRKHIPSPFYSQSAD